MGATTSKTAIENDIKNQLGVSAYNNIINTCASVAQASQTIRVSGSTGVKLENISQDMDIENTCKLNSAIEALQKIEGTQDLVSKLEKEQETKGLFALSTDNTNLKNAMSSEVDINTFNTVRTECKNQVSVPQLIEAVNSSDVYLSGISQSNKNYNQCIQDSGLIQDLQAKYGQSSEIDTKVTQKTTGLDLAGLFVPIAIIAGIVLIFFFIINVTGSTTIGGTEYITETGRKISQGGMSLYVFIIVIAILSITGVIVYEWINKPKPENICDPKCENGGKCTDSGCECIGNWTGGQCQKCKIGFSGEDCQSCAEGYTGQDCKMCIPGYVKSGNICVPDPHAQSAKNAQSSIIPTNPVNSGNSVNVNGNIVEPFIGKFMPDFLIYGRRGLIDAKEAAYIKRKEAERKYFLDSGFSIGLY